MNIRMWPDDGPPDLSNELIRAERYAGSLEEANSKLEREVERLSAIQNRLETERDEAQAAARWLFYEDTGHSDDQYVFERWPWLEEEE